MTEKTEKRIKKETATKKRGETAKPRRKTSGTAASGAGKKAAKSTGAAKRSAQGTAAKAAKKPSGAKAPAKAARGTAAAGSRRSRREARMAAGNAGKDAVRAVRRSTSAEVAPDMFMDPPKRRPKASGGTKHRALCAVLSLVFVAGMAYIGSLIQRQQVAYAQFQEMKQVVESQTFYEGTTVEGKDVSAMTLRAALEYWRTRVEPKYAERTVTLDDGTKLTAAEMGYVSDYESVLSNAWSAGRRGSLESRYRAAISHQQSPVAYRVTRVLFDEGLVDAFVQKLASEIDTPVKNAAVKSFNAKKGTFAFTEAESGRKLDAEALRQSIGAALQAGGGEVTRSIEVLAPKVTSKALKKQFGRISDATTNASSSSANRLNNIRQALKYINGTCLEPGETFSFNQTVGKRTTDRGFKVATAYSAGDVTEEVGGGICQVSTTLFNAAVKADLQIVERHNHSLTVAYVDNGKDATVNWGSQDLRFKNNTGDKVYILCYLTEDKRVRFGIFGKRLANGETITVEAETLETIDFDTDYEPTPDLEKGKQKLVSNGKPGCKAVAYKVRWSAKGKEISRELLCKSWYKAKNAVVAVGM